MPELNDHYNGAEILLPRMDAMARGHVIMQCHITSGNTMERAHINPILDTKIYQVEFAGGKVTELTSNVIAESLYAQCNADGNEYLVLDVLVDYYKVNRVSSLTECWQICYQ